MCGIVGYIGWREAAPILIAGLKKLEYRGYDSFGIVTIGRGIEICKHEGKISERAGSATSLSGTAGIGHTRWATHGIPSDLNAHPHLDCTGRIAIVHNGIIENYAGLRRELAARGHTFLSETDTEVIAHVIEEHYTGDLLAAVQAGIPRLQGSFALLIISSQERRIIAVRQASPLVIGIGDGELFAASDMTPILEHTERAVFLEDGDVADLSRETVSIYHGGAPAERQIELIDWSAEDTRKGGFPHFMLKEIYEQPQVFYNSVRACSRENLPPLLGKPSMVTIVACGSSYHAGLIFKYFIEEDCGIPARLEFASEFRHYLPPVSGLVVGITQSGETADTISALKEAKVHGCQTLAITNVLGSTASRVADATVFMHAGPEISVAATKSFTAQLAVLMQLVTCLSDDRTRDVLLHGHRAIEEILLKDLSEAVALCRNAGSIFYVGRGPFYPVALEGALKMKEISYIHAEGYAAGELKHGPFALLSQETPVIAICMPDRTYGVMLSNIKEIKARGAPVIGLGSAGDRELPDIVDLFIQVLTSLVVLQLLAYHTAVALGRDVDKPRNLAKSVTVE